MYHILLDVAIPDPLTIREDPSALVVVSLLLGSISSVAVILSAIFALLQYRKSVNFSRLNYIHELKTTMVNDPDIYEITSLFDYGNLGILKSFTGLVNWSVKWTRLWG